MTQDTVKSQDRRKPRPTSLARKGLAVQARNRIEVVARELLDANDQKSKELDPKRWLNEYKVLEHSVGLGLLLATMCDVEGSEDEAILYSAAMYHDISKTKGIFAWLNRRRKNFNQFERWLMGWHPLGSAIMAWWKLRRLIREEEHHIMWDIVLLALYHHKVWWLFFNQRLRQLGWRLMFCDAYKAHCEKRHRAGLAPEKALPISIRRLKEGKIPAWAMQRYREEIEYTVELMHKSFARPTA